LVVHGEEATLRPQELPVHTLPALHSALPVQVGSQAVASGLHAKGAQVTDAGATQLPMPSHVLVPTTVFGVMLHADDLQMVCVPQ
jgi:hypothetical protein